MASPPAYVRAKWAEAVSELARLDWPAKWPELQPALVAAAACPVASPAPALFALGVWTQLAEVLAEDSKELTVQRRRELSGALTKLVEQPAQAPELVACLQSVLQRHGADQQVVREALGLCRALASAVPVQLLLVHSLDKIVQVGLQRAPTHDLCRFTAMLAKLAGGCIFDPEDSRSYAFHRQVAELLCDFCASNATTLSQLMSCADLSVVWQALLHLLRYPSAAIQNDAVAGMSHLARAQAGRPDGSPPRPPLDRLVGVIFVHCLRLDTLPGCGGSTSGALSVERSTWLLGCLGPPSVGHKVSTFEAWCQLLAVSHSFDLLDGEADAQERSHLFGALKTQACGLLREVCKPQLGAGVAAPEGYGALCRHAGALVARALAGGGPAEEGWAAEFEAATSLLETSGPAALRLAESSGQLAAVLLPSLAFLKQVTVRAGAFSCAVEHKRLEFLSFWGPYYKHLGEEVLGQVLQQLTAVIGQPPAVSGGEKLQIRALDSLVGITKWGALGAHQLEALNIECQRLSSQVSSPAARGKLVEALAAAVATCPSLEQSRRVEIISGIMQQATTSWLSSELVASARPEALLSVLVAAANAGVPPERIGRTDVVGPGHAQEPNLSKLRDIRTLLATFTGVVTKASQTPSKPGDAVASEAVAVASGADSMEGVEAAGCFWFVWLIGFTTTLVFINSHFLQQTRNNFLLLKQQL
ncbi:unnamed protein product [Polarella glacialis]|uniref:Exportin-1/Importin-beta-like domain-containing protein n=1 Tax=Polarella glacialis TaxID=89957 RepID=A0A813IYM8_POLGL|nr:unnamed protein product [Polarella glacialis]